MNPFSPEPTVSRRDRALVAGLLIVCFVLFLSMAFFRTQIVGDEDYVLRDEANRMQVVMVPAPRGTIYDRHGEILAETLVEHILTLQPTTEDSARVALALLQPALGMDEARMAELNAALAADPAHPLRIHDSLDAEQVAWVEEHRRELPGVRLERSLKRHYPEGEAVAHLIGYVAEIDRAELADTMVWKGYRSGQEIGKAGIEREYETVLGGTLGEEYLEVDDEGQVVGSLAPREEIPPEAGRPVQLTVDLELQRYIHEIFPANSNGAVVAIEPKSGEVLALYSHPTFDPNLLIDGDAAWQKLNADARQPLLNRATSGIYPPGSTWNLATAVIALEKGIIEPDSHMPIPCTGGLSYAGRYSRCWDRSGHGSLDLAGAIAESCNVYFYQLGIWLGLNQLAEGGTRLGFSRPTGIDLPSEQAGTFPQDAGWYRDRFGWEPTPSEVMSLAIGQGPNSQTPLRMAQFFAAVGGNGRAPTPHLRKVRRVAGDPETDLRLQTSTVEAVRTGLGQITEPGGSAFLASLENWKVWGKTGTSQNTENPSRPHAWFTGFAGAEDGEPEIAFAVVVEQGRSGTGGAAPIGAKVADFYLNRKHGKAPTDTQQVASRTEAAR